MLVRGPTAPDDQRRRRGGALVSVPYGALGVGIGVVGLAFDERLFRKSTSG
jgi:hypothetical protein